MRAERAAFTMIEIMVVFGVIVILTSIVLGVSSLAQRKARHTRALKDLETLRTAIHEYRLAKNRVPPEPEDNEITEEWLKEHLEKYISSEFPSEGEDPWGEPYLYKNVSRYVSEVWSGGPDREWAEGPGAEANADNVVQ